MQFIIYNKTPGILLIVWQRLHNRVWEMLVCSSQCNGELYRETILQPCLDWIMSSLLCNKNYTFDCELSI